MTNKPLASSELRPYFKKSLFLHGGVLLALLLFKIIDHFILSDDQRNLNLKIAQASVRVDVVQMPKMTLQELKNINLDTPGALTQTESQVIQVSKETSSIEYEKAKEKKNFMDMIKTFGSRKTSDDTLKKTNLDLKNTNLKKNDLGKINELVLSGNKISQGFATIGDSSQGEQGEFENYISTLPDRVRPFWKLPSYLLDKELKCRLRVYLNESGQLLKSEIFESSGSPEFDERALEALKKAVPFPQLPPGIAKRALKGEIILGFPL